MGQGNQGGGPDERLAKIQRYRERHALRGQARMPNYQPARSKVGSHLPAPVDAERFDADQVQPEGKIASAFVQQLTVRTVVLIAH